MKRSFLLLALAAVLIFSGCHPIVNTPDISVDLPGVTAPQPTEPEETSEPATEEPVTEAPSSEPTQEPSEEPTEPEEEPQVPGFDCGILTTAAGKVFSAEATAICVWENGNADIICEPGWSEPKTICTNGTVLYFIDDDRRLCRVNVADGSMEAITGSFIGEPYLQGAVRDTVYVSCWSEDAYWAPDVYMVDATDGSISVTDHPVDVRCENGFLVIRDFATDVSAKPTWIYNGAGELILDGVVTWRVGINNGELWYCTPDNTYDENQFMDRGVHIFLWAETFWIVYADYEMETEGYYGVNLVDDCFVAYGNYGAQAFRLSDASPVDEAHSDFLQTVTQSFATESGKFYQTYDQVWHQTEEGDLELMASASMQYTWPRVVITDAIYMTSEAGTVSVSLP